MPDAKDRPRRTLIATHVCWRLNSGNFTIRLDRNHSLAVRDIQLGC